MILISSVFFFKPTIFWPFLGLLLFFGIVTPVGLLLVRASRCATISLDKRYLKAKRDFNPFRRKKLATNKIMGFTVRRVEKSYGTNIQITCYSLYAKMARPEKEKTWLFKFAPFAILQQLIHEIRFTIFGNKTHEVLLATQTIDRNLRFIKNILAGHLERLRLQEKPNTPATELQNEV